MIEEPSPQVLDYIYNSWWIYAVTMPANPHWYTVRPRPRDNGHEALFELLRDHHVLKLWHRYEYRSRDIGPWVYWIIEDGTVINRKPVAFAGWDGEVKPPKSWCPDEWRRNIHGSEELLTETKLF